VSADHDLPGRPVHPWTVGDLRGALEGVPDDLPLRVLITEEPGGDFIAEQAVISAGPWNDERDGAPPDYFEIGCNFPASQYRRP
jgi:uncharacterized protein DUF6225